MEHQKYTKFFVSLVILLLAGSALLLPGILRKENTLIGDKPYYHLRLAQTDKDELSFSGRYNELSFGWNFVLKYVPMNIALFVLGLITIVLLYLNLKSLRLNHRFLSVAIFTLSPAFIYMFSIGERFGIAFVLSLVISYLVIKEKYKFLVLPFIVLLLFDISITIFALTCLGLYLLYFKKDKSIFYGIVTIIFLLLLIIGKWKFNLISDFGSNIGVSVFALVFVLFCFTVFWRKLLPMFGILFILILISLKFEFGIFYLSVFLSVLLSLCLANVYDAKWESELIRDFMILLVFCGLLFSGLSYTNRLSQEMPHQEIFDALESLPEGAVVFSDITYGHWITYSGKKNVWDTFTRISNFDEIEKELNSAIDSRDSFLTKQILDKYNVDYIFVDPALTEKWNGKGIIYLLEYDSGQFRRIYDRDGTIIWRHYK